MAKKKKHNFIPPSQPTQGSPGQITRLETSMLRFSGPLPPPEILEKYNNSFPGCTERIVAMAERQSTHRQEIERMVIGGSIASEKRGSYLGFGLALIVILGGFALIYSGQVGVGAALVISDIMALAGTYLYGKRRQRQELSEKQNVVL